jgi:hypothetical protein
MTRNQINYDRLPGEPRIYETEDTTMTTKTTTTHTPGPWHVYGNRYIYGDGPVVAKVTDTNWRWQDASMLEANARLIAASPDMLDALRDILIEDGACSPGECDISQCVWQHVHEIINRIENGENA